MNYKFDHLFAGGDVFPCCAPNGCLNVNLPLSGVFWLIDNCPVCFGIKGFVALLYSYTFYRVIQTCGIYFP